jgi:hypothetical protein
VIGALGERGFFVERGILFSRGDKRDACAWLQFCAEQGGEQMILLIVETASGFFGEVAAVVPLVARLASTCRTF